MSEPLWLQEKPLWMSESSMTPETKATLGEEEGTTSGEEEIARLERAKREAAVKTKGQTERVETIAGLAERPTEQAALKEREMLLKSEEE